MIPNQNEALQAIQNARQALRRGDHGTARRWAEHAAALAPQMEEPWLILAVVASPHASVAYIERVLKVNPNSQRARQGMRWALQRLQSAPQQQKAGSLPRAKVPSRRLSTRQWYTLPAFLIILTGLVLALAAWSGNISPALAFIRSNVGVPMPTSQQSWAQVKIAKPTYTPTPTPTFTPTPTLTPTATPTNTPTPTPTDTPTNTPEPTWTPEPAWTPEPWSTPVPYIPQQPKQPQTASGSSGHWIDVDLSAQRVYAYEGNVLVQSFLVSTGTWQHPTITGKYRIYAKLRYTDMTGADYYLPDVPYTMFYYKDYALHGTYWHHNFGVPMSHGCINLSIADAAWLYSWVSVGTVVNIHY